MKTAIKEVEKIEVFALMDDRSDHFTVNHLVKLNEDQYQVEKRGCREYDGATLCRACLGLSLLIRVTAPEQIFTLLFDTGPDDGLALENAKRLGLDLQSIDAIFLSHGHFDHISGAYSFLREMQKETPVYLHPDVFVPRAHKFQDNEIIRSKFVLDEATVVACNGLPIRVSKPTTIFDSSALISGEVPRKTAYEKGALDALNLVDGKWQEAPEVLDEQVVIFNLKGKGLCVFTGCGHTGVVNALNYAVELTGERIYMIMGGFHLAAPSNEERIAKTVADLKRISPELIVTGHCTGLKAQAQLMTEFGDRHIPYGVGAYFQFPQL